MSVSSALLSEGDWSACLVRRRSCVGTIEHSSPFTLPINNFGRFGNGRVRPSLPATGTETRRSV